MTPAPGALVTRPREDAEGIARALAARGFAVQIEPMLEIAIERGIALPLDGVQAYLATSANGVRALAANLAGGRGLEKPLWAVGDATARTAREAGFQRVESADGDVEGLATLVAARVDRQAGALLHAAGSRLAGDLAERLGRSGFEVRRLMLYRAEPAAALSQELLAALRDGRLDLALFFSPRTAQTFATLACAAGCQDLLRRIAAYGLSPAVTRELAALPWKTVRAADRPWQEGLLAAIDQDFMNLHPTGSGA